MSVIVTQWQVSGPDSGAPGGGGTTIAVPKPHWVGQGGVWHEVSGPGSLTPEVQAQAAGSPRIPSSGAVHWNGDWRSLEEGLEFHGDPGDGIDDIGCTSLVLPTIPSQPLTGRLFFCWNLAASLMNTSTPFNASVEGKPSAGMINAAAAQGGAIIGSHGGYEKFHTGGVYDPNKMDDFIESLLPLSAFLEAAQLAGIFYGVSVADDFEGRNLWRPNGLSITELGRICTKWKTTFPWSGGAIRTTIRGRPSQFPGGITNLDSAIAQFRRHLGTPTEFRDRELNIANNIGVDILWSLNWLKGGNGSSGIDRGGGLYEMTATEVADALSVFCTTPTRNHGAGGWKFDALLLNRPGMMDALMFGHNLLAALP